MRIRRCAATPTPAPTTSLCPLHCNVDDGHGLCAEHADIFPAFVEELLHNGERDAERGGRFAVLLRLAQEGLSDLVELDWAGLRVEGELAQGIAVWLYGRLGLWVAIVDEAEVIWFWDAGDHGAEGGHGGERLVALQERILILILILLCLHLLDALVGDSLALRFADVTPSGQSWAGWLSLSTGYEHGHGHGGRSSNSSSGTACAIRSAPDQYGCSLCGSCAGEEQWMALSREGVVTLRQRRARTKPG